MADTETNLMNLQRRKDPVPDDWEEWMDWGQEPTQNSPSPREQVTNPKSTSSLSPKYQPKRKFSPGSDEEYGHQKQLSASEGKALQDRSHSVVEKRYRENLNQKIADLGDCIPSLQADGKGPQRGAGPSYKRNKATVLTEAMAYIQHLEKRNAYLEKVNTAMRDQMQRHERNGRSEVMTSNEDMKENGDRLLEGNLITREQEFPENEPQGMIPVPEEMRRLWRNQSQEHYADGMYEADESSDSTLQIKGGKYFGRMVVGSLAGLMILDGFATPHGKVDKREDRGLSAVPLHYLVPNLRRFIARYRGALMHPSPLLLSHFYKALLLFCVLGLMLFLYLYYSRPPPRKLVASSTNQPVRSLASPLEVRQNAWLTSIQTVWVPRHHILPEMMALILETAAYLTRQVLGWRYYLWLTGRSREEEVADIRAWDIAIDAQLSGGDPEVSKGRLVLTLWAAGTLPSTPMRLMLKALHIRVLFWRPSNFDSVSRVMHKIAFLLARYQWNKASNMRERLEKTSKPVGLGQSEPLPDHLQALLEQSTNDVLNDGVIQRAHNFVWNRHSEMSAQDAIDTTADDSAMRGPLDLIASRFSGSKFRAGLQKILRGPEARELIRSDLDLAILTAPPRSTTSACAILAKEIFLDFDRGSFLSKIRWALPHSFPAGDVPAPSTSAIEIQIMVAAYCALALSKRDEIDSAVTDISNALRLICHRPAETGLLGSTTTSHTLTVLFERLAITDEQLISGLRKDMHRTLTRLEELATPDIAAMEMAARKALCATVHQLLDAEGDS